MPDIVPTPVRRRSQLRLIRIYTIARKPTILSKITMSIYLHFRMHQIEPTKVRRRNLLRPVRAYTIRGKPSIITNLSSSWDAANNVYPDQTPQLAAPNRGLHPRGKPKILSKTAIQFYHHVGTQRIMSTKIRRRSVLRLIGAYVHNPAGNQQFSENNHLNLSPCWDPANSTYPDQTPQLAALNRGLHHPPGNQQVLAK